MLRLFLYDAKQEAVRVHVSARLHDALYEMMETPQNPNWSEKRMIRDLQTHQEEMISLLTTLGHLPPSYQQERPPHQMDGRHGYLLHLAMKMAHHLVPNTHHRKEPPEDPTRKECQLMLDPFVRRTRPRRFSRQRHPRMPAPEEDAYENEGTASPDMSSDLPMPRPRRMTNPGGDRGSPSSTDESEHVNPVEQARDELLKRQDAAINAGKKVIESQRELMNLFWQRLDLIRRTQSASTEDSTTMECEASDSMEMPSQDSAMSEDIDLSDPAWRMSHPHLVRAMEARATMSDKENETQTGSEDEDYIDMPPMSVIRRYRDPKARRLLWSDDTGPCVSPTDTPPIPTTLDAMEEASEGSQPENIAPTVAIAVPDAPDDAENRDEEKEDNEPALTTPEPTREDRTPVYAAPYPGGRDKDKDKCMERKMELLTAALRRASRMTQAVRDTASAWPSTRTLVNGYYRDITRTIEDWKIYGGPDPVPKLLQLARDQYDIVEEDRLIGTTTKQNIYGELHQFRCLMDDIDRL